MHIEQKREVCMMIMMTYQQDPTMYMMELSRGILREGRLFEIATMS